MKRALIFALLAACTAATEPPPTAPPTPTPTVVRPLTVRALGPDGLVAGATVCAARTGSSGEEPCERTASDGTARFTLPQGTYTLRATPPAGARAAPGVTTLDLAGTSFATVLLEGRARIGGRVRDENGDAVAGAEACAHPATAAPVICGRTDATGAYLLEVRPAVYKLEFHGAPGARLVDQWAHGRVGSFEADAFDARERDVAGIDVTLLRGVVLSGTVRAAREGEPVRDAEVCTMTFAAPLPWDCEHTDRRGRYALLRQPGTYWVWVFPPDVRGSRLIPQRYDRALTGFEAKGLSLLSDATLEVALIDGPLIRGRVTTRDGAPLFGALVCADTPFPTGRICRETLEDGSYTVATRPETYVVNVVAPAESGAISAYWSDKRDWTEADPVVVGSADVELDIALLRGVRISGTVRTPEGIPVQNATVNLNDAAGIRAAAATDHRGRYRTSAPAGTYTVDVFSPRISLLSSLVGAVVRLDGDEVGYDVVLPFAEP